MSPPELGPPQQAAEFQRPVLFEKPVPFAELIFAAAKVMQTEPGLTDLIAGSLPYQKSWLSVQDQRKMENPVIKIEPGNPQLLEPTALEAHFYGACNPNGSLMTPEQIILTLASMGADALDTTARLHRADFNFTSRMERVLTENRTSRPGDAAVLAETEDIWVGLLAKLKSMMATNSDALSYRETTHKVIDGVLPSYELVIDPQSGQIVEKYRLRYIPREKALIKPANPTWDWLNDKQRKGWKTLLGLGKIGNPLVRAISPFIHESARLRKYF